MSASAARRKRRIGHAALGFGLFALLAAGMMADPGRSRAAALGRLAPAGAQTSPQAADAVMLASARGYQHAAAAAAALSPVTAWHAPADRRLAASLTLAAILSTLAVLNVGFLRHLRRVYASPRRGVGRRK